MARLIKLFKVLAISSLVLNGAPFVFGFADGNVAFAKAEKSKEKGPKDKKSKEKKSKEKKSKEKKSKEKKSKQKTSKEKASNGKSSKDKASDKKDKAPKQKQSASKASDKAKGGAASSASTSKSSNTKSSDDKSSKSSSKKTLLDLFRKPAKETVVEPKPVETAKPKVKAKPKKVKKAPAVVAKKKKTPAKKANPDIALGSLSAALATEQALQNADPDSQVGKIAAYKKKVLLAESLRADILKTKSQMEAGLQSHMTLSEHAYLFAAETTKMNAIEREIAEIITALNAVGGVNEELEADLKEAEKLLIAQINTVLDLERQEAVLQGYWSTWDDLATRQEALDRHDAEAWQMLEDAADKPLTLEVVTEVHRLLGLPTFAADSSEGDNLTLLLD